MTNNNYSYWNNGSIRSVIVMTLAATAIATTSAFTAPSQGQHIHATATTALCMAKTIAVFGASGLTASECVYQALKNGDTVVGLTRYGRECIVTRTSDRSLLTVRL